MSLLYKERERLQTHDSIILREILYIECNNAHTLQKPTPNLLRLCFCWRKL